MFSFVLLFYLILLSLKDELTNHTYEKTIPIFIFYYDCLGFTGRSN